MEFEWNEPKSPADGAQLTALGFDNPLRMVEFDPVIEGEKRRHVVGLRTETQPQRLAADFYPGKPGLWSGGKSMFSNGISFHFGWLIIFVGFLVTSIRAGIGMQTLGFILYPMEREMGWSASSITLCITLQLVVAAIVGPKVGKLLDRVGAKKILVSGLVANGLMLILVSMVQELWQLAAVMILLGGITQACIGNTMIMPFITKWFKKGRGFVMGFVSAGANLGTIFIAPLIVRVMGENADWRTAWFIVGLIPIILIAPVVYVILNKSENVKAKNTNTEAKSKDTDPEITFTVKEAIHTSAFWKVIVAWNLVDFAMKGILLNKIPYALEMGFTTADAAGVLISYGVCALLGKLLIGWLSDRVTLKRIGMVLAAFQTLGIFMFIDARDAFALYVSYGVLSGLSAGGLIALMPIILADYFGSKFQGSLSGITISLLLFSSVGGPLSASVIKDITGSYQTGFTLYTLMTVLAVILFIMMNKPVKGAVNENNSYSIPR